jgi:hypothetical protein
MVCASSGSTTPGRLAAPTKPSREASASTAPMAKKVPGMERSGKAAISRVTAPDLRRRRRRQAQAQRRGGDVAEKGARLARAPAACALLEAAPPMAALGRGGAGGGAAQQSARRAMLERLLCGATPARGNEA